MGFASLQAFAQPQIGAVMLIANFSALSNVKWVRINRYNQAGTATAVRTNTSSNSSGDFMEVSAGIVVMYDAEAPKDQTLYYVADALDSSGNPVTELNPLFYSSFETSADAAQWTANLGGSVAQSAVRAYVGSKSLLGTAVPTNYSMNSPKFPVSFGESLEFVLWAYSATAVAVSYGTDLYDSTGTFLTSSSTGQTIPAGVWTQLIVNTIVANPLAVTADGFVFGSAFTTGQQIWIDEAAMYNVGGTPTLATATSTEVILGSSGALFLNDPFNPANNLRITLTPTTAALPECVPGEGIFFIGMADRNYGTQTTNWNVNNRSVPIPLTQVRSRATSSLSLVLRTFGDEDALVRLASTGSALYLTIPARYGYETAYLSVGDVTVSRISRDFRRQWQAAALPWVIVGRPAGMMYGMLGTRWKDICSPYATFAAATSAGVTWLQVIEGSASTQALPLNVRTWQQVKTSFASWSAVNNGTRTWQALAAGQ